MILKTLYVEILMFTGFVEMLTDDTSSDSDSDSDSLSIDEDELLVIGVQNVTSPPVESTTTDEYLLNNPGCYIPNYIKNNNYSVYKAYKRRDCEYPIIRLFRLTGTQFKFVLNREELGRIRRTETPDGSVQNFQVECNYRFADAPRVTYSIRDGDLLNISDDKVIYFKCVSNFITSQAKSTYFDAFVPYIPTSAPKTVTKAYQDVFVLLAEKNEIKNKYFDAKWNVLMIGIDSMSRGRIQHQMPLLVKHLVSHGWLDFQGHHKVAEKTLANLVAIFTGNSSNDCLLNRKCIYETYKRGIKPFIWDRYKDLGYTTILGSDKSDDIGDYFDMYDDYDGTSIKVPLDHKYRLITDEHEIFGNKYHCFGSTSAGQHMLDFTLQFLQAYENGSFFGIFYSTVYSAHSMSQPEFLEDLLLGLLDEIVFMNIMENTFIIFFSDGGGMKYGKSKFKFFDERLPMMFMWVPRMFKKMFPKKYENLILNQKRMTNHLDLYATLVNILEIQLPEKVPRIVNLDCKECKSLFEEISPDRKCPAGIGFEWCTCFFGLHPQ